MTSLSKSFRLSSTLKIEEEAMAINKNQGIGSILIGSDISDERSSKSSSSSSSSSSSLRRTLSADMSSTKWLTQQGFSSPMKKIASSEEFSICSITDSSSSEEEYEEDAETEPRSQFDIWSSIQEEKKKEEEEEEEEDEKSGQFDIWSSIIQTKSQEIANNKPLPPPYIHPLVKRSSSLSEKSLQVCTESLGSETGSDGFSSYPASESGDANDDEKETGPEHQEQRVGQSFENFGEVFFPKYSYGAAAAKKSPARSFPPPIPSLRDGACVRMQPRRDNGRLVLEAVSVPSTNNFLARRHDGRLVLTLVNSVPATEALRVEQEEKNREVEELDEEFETSFDDDDEDKESDDESEEEEEEEEEETDAEDEEDEGGDESEVRGVKETPLVMEQAPKLSSRVMNLHRLTLKGVRNTNPTWANKFNEVVKFDEVEDDLKTAIVATSLPPIVHLIPKPTAAAAAGKVTAAAAGRGGGGEGGGGTSLNAYEYYWRRPNPMMTTTITQSKCNILSKNSNSVENNNQDQQQVLVLRGNKGDYLVPLVKSCKESRRSLLFWEPNCIATS